jgi:phenylacetate-CoA ligase
MQTALQAEESRDFRPALAGGLTVGLSSGTSGHRGLFLVSPQEQAAWAGVILARALRHVPWRALRRGGLRLAFFLRSNSNLYEQTRSALLRFRYFDLMQPLETSVAALNDFQPEILIGPPLLLGLLAQEMDAGRLSIHPERLISVAEVLEAQDARRLEHAFQVCVEQIYQCTEGLMAVACAAGSLHVQEDLLAMQFEALGEVQPGEPPVYTPVVTDLWRTTQPIIRYRLNDVVALNDAPCACGSTFEVLARIEGRCDDICYFPPAAGGRLRPFFPDTIRRMILLAHPDIQDYLAVQDAPGRLCVYLSTRPIVGADGVRPDGIRPDAPLAPASFAHIAAAVHSRATEIVQGYGCVLDRTAAGGGIEVIEGVPPLPAGVKRRRVQAANGRDGRR